MYTSSYSPKDGFNTSVTTGSHLLRSWTLAGLCSSNAFPRSRVSSTSFPRKISGSTRNVLWTHFGLDSSIPAEYPTGSKVTLNIANDIYVHDSNALALSYKVGYKYQNFNVANSDTISNYYWSQSAVTGTGS